MNFNHYSHIHFSASDDKGMCVGGHLNEAIISATCEIIIHIIHGSVNRKLDTLTSLSLFEF